MPRSPFLARIPLPIPILLILLIAAAPGCSRAGRGFNEAYSGAYLNRVAFPIGGIGAGMFCLEGTGAISHMSVRNSPQVFHEPHTYAALCVKGDENVARVLEGPIPAWKTFRFLR